MQKKVEFPENVFLIDAAFLNFIISDLKGYFEQSLGRSLKKADLTELITLLAIDAGIQEEGKEIQVIWVYDKSSASLHECVPASLEKELNGVAFSDRLGEFVFASICSEEMVSREELYQDMLRILLDAEGVKKIVLVAFKEDYEEVILSDTATKSGKEIVNFVMEQRHKKGHVTSETLAYPLMQTLGIKGEEL